MKKSLFLAAVAALLFASCAKEQLPQNCEQTAMKTVTFTSDDLTKMTTTLTGQVSWEEKDTVSIYYVNSASEAVEVKSPAILNGGSASFVIEIPETENPDHYYACYPQGQGVLTPAEGETAEVFSLKVGSSDGSFRKSNYMAAYTTAQSANFAFKNACGMFRVKIPSDGKIVKGSQTLTLKGVQIKGQDVSIKSQGTVPVIVADGAVSDFGEPTSVTQRAIASDIPSEVLADGYVYMPSLPGEATNGIYVLYTTVEDVYLPAVLSDNTKAVTITRGHIKPLSCPTDKLVYDYYVSSTGTGDGKSESAPMSFTAMVEKFTLAKDFIYRQASLNGTTFHIKGETFDASAAMPFNFSGSNGTHIVFEGGWQGGKTVIDAKNAVRHIQNKTSYLTFNNIEFTQGKPSATGGGALLSEGGSVEFNNCIFRKNGNTALAGGAIYCLAGNLVLNDCDFISNSAGTGNPGGAMVVKNASIKAKGCRFVDNTCLGNSGGAINILADMTKTAYFTNCIFTGSNTGANYGSAIHTSKPSATTAVSAFIGINNCLFINNYGSKKAADGNANVSIAFAHCVINSSFISPTANPNVFCWRCGATADAGSLGGSLIVNSIFNNESTASGSFAPYSISTVNTTYFVRSAGYNQYSTANENGQFSPAANDNQIGLPSAGTKASLNTYTWDSASYAWAWDASSKTGDMVDLATMENMIKEDKIEGKTTAVCAKAAAFVEWLKSISYNDGADNAFTVDLYGKHRDPDAVWPGCYQK